MTRENKLGMVVGFGLLLFVGILVSDHFSAAQRQETTRITRGESGRERPVREISLAPLPAAGAVGVQPEFMPTAASDTMQASLPGAVQNAPARVAEPVAPVASGARGAASKRQEGEPGVRLRPIADGETLYSICKKEYGDGSLATALAAYNKKAVPDPKRVRKGVTIQLPPVEVLRPNARGTRAQAAPAAEPAVPEASVPALAVADVIAADSGAPAGGVVTVDVAPGRVKGGDAKAPQAKSSKKSSAKPAKKPAARPVASKPTVS